MSNALPWPLEASVISPVPLRWSHAGSNLSLDFHGDPITARLAVFSDGNHHMALEAALQAFRRLHPEVDDIFYATTPPGVLLDYLANGHLCLGNLRLSRLPDVFISPANILDKLQAERFVTGHCAFMQSRGNVLLVRKGNPKQIQGIADLLRKDVRLFISNPDNENASYVVYRDSLLGLAAEQGLAVDAMAQRLVDATRTVFGECIHHREAPQCLYDDRADVAMIYYHLALRYTRIFPGLFDFIPLGGSREDPQPAPANLSTVYHIGVVGSGGQYGAAFVEFMLSDEVTRLYAAHGLVRPV